MEYQLIYYEIVGEKDKKGKIKKYIDLLKERSEEKRVTRPYQMTGLEIAEILGDKEHKSLYIKLAKEMNNQFLLELARDVAERPNIENKGAYFMTLLKKKKDEISNNGK